jgi:hypothetical protein
VLQVNAPDAAPPEPLPLLGFVELALEDGEQAGDAVVKPAEEVIDRLTSTITKENIVFKPYHINNCQIIRNFS